MDKRQTEIHMAAISSLAHQSKSRHPGLRRVLSKLSRREPLSDEDKQIFVRQLAALEQKTPYVKADGRNLLPNAKLESMLRGHATRGRVERFIARFGKDCPGFYGATQDILISNIGIGTYRGGIDDKIDEAYAVAIQFALERGVNLIDTSINYRYQRSELAVSAGLRRFIEISGGRRDEIVICTKGGYLVPDAYTRECLEADEIAGGKHCMAPAFLCDQINRSRGNLGIETIDVYYLHNPEFQLNFVSIHSFMSRIRAAFETLERAVSNRYIRYYGTATWDGYTTGALSLSKMAKVARDVAGDGHHFRFVQLPINLGMRQALALPVEDNLTILDLAVSLGITIIASSSLMQGRLSCDLPDELKSIMVDPATDAQRAIQFARSTPGISCSLVGMRDIGHVAENLSVAKVHPFTREEYNRFLFVGD